MAAGGARSRPPGSSSCSSTRRESMLDGFYLVIGIVGFVALWGITKACNRV
jgi:hypothetical protein